MNDQPRTLVELKFPLPNETFQFKGYLEWPAGSGNKIGTIWWHRLSTKLKVMRSIFTMNDGSKWAHLVVSREGQYPSMEELAKARAEFLPWGMEAVIRMPEMKTSFPNEFLVHIWARVTGNRGLPSTDEIEKEEAL